MDGGLWHCTGGSDQDHPQEEEMQKGQIVVWGGLTKSWQKKRIERHRRKGKIYTCLNSKIQRIARRDKKAFLNDQCKEIEENNRRGRTRDLFKKIRDTKGTFHAKMGSIKDRNGIDLTEQKILRRGGKNTQKNCTKKIFTTQIIMMVWSLTQSQTSGMWSQVGLRKHHYEQS